MPSRNLLCGCLLLACAVGCEKKDEAPAPLASAAEAPPSTNVSPAAPAEAPQPGAAAPQPQGNDASDAGARAAESATADGGVQTTESAAKKPAPTASIKGCCAALAKATGDTVQATNRYKSAAAVCNGLAQSVNAGTATPGAARLTLRAQLQGLRVPGGC
jgi:hypothetical protein